MYLHNTLKLSEYQQEEINGYKQALDEIYGRLKPLNKRKDN